EVRLTVGDLHDGSLGGGRLPPGGAKTNAEALARRAPLDYPGRREGTAPRPGPPRGCLRGAAVDRRRLLGNGAAGAAGAGRDGERCGTAREAALRAGHRAARPGAAAHEGGEAPPDGARDPEGEPTLPGHGEGDVGRRSGGGRGAGDA